MSNIIGNPKRKRFSFGYSNFFGEFGFIDLGIVILILIFSGLYFAFLGIWLAILLTLLNIGIMILLTKQFGNEKSYDFIVNAIKFFFSQKNTNGYFLLNDEEEFIVRIENGFNFNLLTQEEIDEIVSKFNAFIKLYDGDWKIFKYNSGFKISKNTDYIEDQYNWAEQELVREIQKIFLHINYDLEKLNFNPEVYFIFKNPTKAQLNLIGNFDLGLSFSQISKIEFDKIKTNLIFEGITFANSVKQENKEELVISSAKFNREVNFQWLLYLFQELQTEFILEINSVTLQDRNRVIKQLNKQKVNYKTKNSTEDFAKEKTNQANEEVLEDIILSKEELKLINLITIFHKDIDSEVNLNSQYKHFALENYHYSDFKLVKEYFRQKQTLETAFKWNNGVYPTTNTTISNSYPFFNQTYIDNEGVYLGTIDDRFPFIFDSWSLKDKSNFHTIILGSSGSGKTTFMKMLMASEFANKKGIHIIIDPHNEFEQLTFKMKGNAYDLAKIKLNPLRFENVTNENFDDKIKSKMLSIKEFLKLIYRNEVSPKLNSEIQRLLIEIEQFFINNKLNLLNGTEYIFSDLIDLLSDTTLIKPITHGIYKDFNSFENIDFDTHIISFQAKNLFIMEEEYKNTIIFLLMNKINEIIYANQFSNKLINFYIDEAGKFLRNEFLINKLSPLFSEARKFNTKLTVATQNITDLYNGESTDINLANIFANASNMFIGYLKNDQRKILDNFLIQGNGRNLTKSEHNHINKKKGHFLYISDNKRYSIIANYDEKLNSLIEIY